MPIIGEYFGDQHLVYWIVRCRFLDVGFLKGYTVIVKGIFYCCNSDGFYVAY